MSFSWQFLRIMSSSQNDNADDIVLTQVKCPYLLCTEASQMAADLHDFDFRLGVDDYSVASAIEYINLHDMG